MPTRRGRSGGPSDKRAAAPARDQLDVLLSVNPNPGKLAELFGVPLPEGEKLVSQVRAARELLFELVAEADALATDTAGDNEEFLMRYPDHPFAASALFATGHFDQLRARFPKHPLSGVR